MDAKTKPKVGFFSKMLDWINRLYPFKREAADTRKSRFEEYLKQGEKAKNTGVVEAVKLCDEALDIVSDRIILINRLTAVEERMVEVEAYGRLTPDDVEDMKDLLARYASLAKDSNSLKYQVTSFDKGLTRLETVEEQAAAAVPEIKYAEERQRIFKQDINYLEGEKMVLGHENERLRNAIDFVYKFTIAMILFFAGMSLFLVFLYIFRNIQTMLILSSMLVLIVIVSGLLYALRMKLRNELNLNMRKQARCVELTNKKIAVYAHFTNYLNYEYRKYRVRNAQMLENNLQDFSHYKHLTRRLDSIRNIMSQTEDALDYFLKDKGITEKFASVEKFANTVSIDDKMHYYQELFREKNLIEKSLKRLENRSSQIWDSLMALKAKEQEDTATIDKIIEEYVEKAGRLVDIDKAEGTTALDALMNEGEDLGN